MIRYGVITAVLCASALGSGAIADVTVDVGRFSNTHPVPAYSYTGAWSEYVSSSEIDGRTVLDIDITGIMSQAGEQYLRSITIRDFGNNSYGPLSPGADIDYVELLGMSSNLNLEAAYSGPTPDHLDETSDELMQRLQSLDAFGGANQRDDDVYVSLGNQGMLNLMIKESGNSQESGGIDPNSGGLASGGYILRIAEAGAYERFTVHLETSSIPAPAAAPVLAGMMTAWRRRRR